MVTTIVAQLPPQPLVAVTLSTLDGRGTVAGRSRPLTSHADRALMQAWREAADLLLVGRHTLEAERYGSMIRPAGQRRRSQRGLPAVPPIATVSRSGQLDFAAALRANEPPQLLVYSGAAQLGGSPVPSNAPQPQLRQLDRCTVTRVVEDLRQRSGGLIVCEGGPALLSLLLRAELIDHLSLSVAPMITGEGGPVLGEAPVPIGATLVRSDARDGFAFLQYSRPRPISA